jgi:hypothetical protein
MLFRSQGGLTMRRRLERGKTGFDMVVRTPEERERVYNPTPSEVADLLMLRTGERAAERDEAVEPSSLERDSKSRVRVIGKQMRRRPASS